MEISKLKHVISRVYQFYVEQSCPCAFPRFRKLVSFNFEEFKISPTACIESHLLIDFALRGSSASFAPTAGPAPDGSTWDFQCLRCGSNVREHYAEYSINMSREYLQFSTLTVTERGAAIETPLPLINGFFGFEPNEWVVLKKSLFFVGCSESDFIDYMTAMA